MKLRFMMILSFIVLTISCRPNKPTDPVEGKEQAQEENSEPLFVHHTPLNLTSNDTVDFTVAVVDFGANKAPRIDVKAAYDVYFYKVCKKNSTTDCTAGLFTQSSHFPRVDGEGNKDVYVTACNMHHRTESKDISCSENWGIPQGYHQAKPIEPEFAAVLSKIEHNELQFLDIAYFEDTVFRIAKDEIQKCDDASSKRIAMFDALIAQGPAVLADSLRHENLQLPKVEENLSLTTKGLRSAVKGLKKAFQTSTSTSTARVMDAMPGPATDLAADLIPHNDAAAAKAIKGKVASFRMEPSSLDRQASFIFEKPAELSPVLRQFEEANTWSKVIEIARNESDIPVHTAITGPKGARFMFLPYRADANVSTNEEKAIRAANLNLDNVVYAYSDRFTILDKKGEKRFFLFISDKRMMDAFNSEFAGKTGKVTRPSIVTNAEISKAVAAPIQYKPAPLKDVEDSMLEKWYAANGQNPTRATAIPEPEVKVDPNFNSGNLAKNQIPAQVQSFRGETITQIFGSEMQRRGYTPAELEFESWGDPEVVAKYKQGLNSASPKNLPTIPTNLANSIIPDADPVSYNVNERFDFSEKPFMDRHWRKVAFVGLVVLGGLLAISINEAVKQTQKNRINLANTCSGDVSDKAAASLAEVTKDVNRLRMERLALYLYLENEYARARGY